MLNIISISILYQYFDATVIITLLIITENKKIKNRLREWGFQPNNNLREYLFL